MCSAARVTYRKQCLGRGRIPVWRLTYLLGREIPGPSSGQGVDALLGEKDRVAGGFGELFNAGRDVDSVTDQSELQLACPADRARDHHTGVTTQ